MRFFSVKDTLASQNGAYLPYPRIAVGHMDYSEGRIMDEFSTGEKAHKIEILQREEVHIEGVVHV